MKTFLITGADGFIGSHLTELLLDKGYKVRALAQYDSVNSLNLNSIGFIGFVKRAGKHFYKSWFNTKLSFTGTKELLKKNLILNTFLIMIPIAIGVFAFIGLFVYYKRLYPILLTFTTFISLFYIIGSEYRRMLPAHPFIFMFGCLGVYFSYTKYYKKNENFLQILADNKNNSTS